MFLVLLAFVVFIPYHTLKLRFKEKSLLKNEFIKLTNELLY